ncbi:MAG: hypothetical protein HY912_10615 [Desulfomonile tiedjei]|uniref:Cytochrome c-552/4 domain-containing protein n=1 Tax=Desulfomonile tiedjei TaxID=2358 RepID=A0A9D6V1S8_9BACT|nr:hypothetical protein [Desulfomonile tiedjei]
MNRPPRAYSLLLVLLGIALITAFGVVEFRSRNPEWKKYQIKGMALALEQLQKEVSQEQSPEKRQKILAEIESLGTRKPEIIEIRPFGGKLPAERCLTCHLGIEDLSKSHPNSVFGCVTCHGGNGTDLTVRGAHTGLRGGKNPATLDLASASCGSNRAAVGSCHSEREHPLLNRIENVPRSLMATNAGIIGILRFQWGIEKDSLSKFGVKQVTDGKISLAPVPPEITGTGEFSLADSHFRKFCAACHLWVPRHRENMGRLEGCPACHAPYGDKGRYSGRDPTIKRDEPGHPATHTITNLIPDDRCRACHNRSARVGLNYHGEMESSQYGSPFVRGELNDETLSDGRFVWKLVPDIHREKGMACIDCHTGQDTMGDGSVHRYMKDQIEIRCEDCHGSQITAPATMAVEKNDPLVQALLRSSPNLRLSDGDTILRTSRGRPLPNVRLTDQGFRLTGKLTGKEHPVSVITGKAAHKITGHNRMECDSCHSAWSPQCYGCHQVLDFRHKGTDHMAGKATQGRWAEGRGYFRYERNIYGINSRGRVGILVPGCQVWNSVVDSSGKVIQPYDSEIMKLANGNSSIAMGPTHPHTTRKEVPRCVDCHLDPKAIGLGEGVMKFSSKNGRLSLEPLYDSASSGLGIDFPQDSVIDVQGKILQGTSHELSRGFNQDEIGRILGIARCLPCHDRYDDPIWIRPGPYKETPACLKALERMQQ